MTEYRLLADTLEAVSSTRRKLAKIALLAQALKRLDGPELVIGARLFCGFVFAEWEQATASVGWAAAARAASAATKWDLETIAACASAIGDLGEAVALLLAPFPAQASLSVQDVDRVYRRLGQRPKAADKQEILSETLAHLSPVEAKYFLKTFSGGLRTGADVTTVEEAIAQAFGADREEVARARRDCGDIGETALAARENRLGAIRFRLFHPIGFMLASPIESAEEMGQELALYAVEDKFDGIRAHAHKEGQRVALFSRTLDDVSDHFPDVVSSLRRLDGTFLLDGEIVAWKDERPDSFFRLQRRLGRKAPEEKLLSEIPAEFIAFDCLLHDEETLFEQPWSTRREHLERIGAPLRLSSVGQARTPADLEALFAAARQKGNEGLVLKRRDSTYQTGKRGRAWRKWKKAGATLDVVVTAVEQGHGKRAGMLSDYTFAVRDGDAFVNIGKAYSGLSDEEIRALGARWRKITTARYRPVRAVLPEIVLEVAFDTIQKSGRHKSGFALRFPRIVRLRTDKGPADANTLDDVRELYARLASSSTISS